MQVGRQWGRRMIKPGIFDHETDSRCNIRHTSWATYVQQKQSVNLPACLKMRPLKPDPRALPGTNSVMGSLMGRMPASSSTVDAQAGVSSGSMMIKPPGGGWLGGSIARAIVDARLVSGAEPTLSHRSKQPASRPRVYRTARPRRRRWEGNAGPVVFSSARKSGQYGSRPSPR
jgi:hypothetical protein